MVEMTTGWLETYPVTHVTAKSTVVGLKKQILWRHGTPERIESDNGCHFKNEMIKLGTAERGIDWISRIPYYPQALGKVEWHNGLLKTMLQARGKGDMRNWDAHLAEATWLVNTGEASSQPGPGQARPVLPP